MGDVKRDRRRRQRMYDYGCKGDAVASETSIDNGRLVGRSIGREVVAQGGSSVASRLGLVKGTWTGKPTDRFADRK